MMIFCGCITFRHPVILYSGGRARAISKSARVNQQNTPIAGHSPKRTKFAKNSEIFRRKTVLKVRESSFKRKYGYFAEFYLAKEFFCD